MVWGVACRTKRDLKGLVWSICVGNWSTRKLWFFHFGNDATLINTHWKCGWIHHNGVGTQGLFEEGLEGRRCGCQYTNLGEDECFNFKTLCDGVSKGDLTTSSIQRSSNSWRNLEDCKIKKRKFGNPYCYCLAKQAKGNWPNNVSASVELTRSSQCFQIHDGATHQVDESIEHKFGPSKGITSFQIKRFIFHHLLCLHENAPKRVHHLKRILLLGGGYHSMKMKIGEPHQTTIF